MTKYLIKLCMYIPMFILGMLLAPVLPLFAHMKDGPANNGNTTEIGPRLIKGLSWFDTSYDNSLWGDNGWRVEHCPNHWFEYIGEVLWLWRNPICGFTWSVLAHAVDPKNHFLIEGDLTASKANPGSYYIKCTDGSFQYRSYRHIGNFVIGIEAGWILDVYVKHPDTAFKEHPKAHFDFQPVFRHIK